MVAGSGMPATGLPGFVESGGAGVPLYLGAPDLLRSPKKGLASAVRAVLMTGEGCDVRALSATVSERQVEICS